MKCIFCSFNDSKVVDSRTNEDASSVRRRRECLKCGKRFTTYETVEIVPLVVVKANGQRQPFDINKIRKGIMKACEKRPVSMSEIDRVVLDMEKFFSNSLEQEIPTSRIGEMVMKELKTLDEVAYVRFASVYKQFTDITTFLKFIEQFDPKSNDD